MKHLALAAALLALPAVALATNPDGPVGSLNLWLSYRAQMDWQREYEARGVTLDGFDVDGVSKNEDRLWAIGAALPFSPYATLFGSFSHLGNEALLPGVDGAGGQLRLRQRDAYSWVNLGMTFHIPFTATAAAELRR